MRAPDRPTWLVLTGIVSVQLGAAFSKHLFDVVSPTALVWLRLVFSTLILLAAVRPRLAGHTRRDWGVVLVFGAALATMNWSIYEAFARIPLGIAVTVEFLGPLTVALVASRSLQHVLWVLIAGAGVGLLGVERGQLDLVGVLFALLAGAMWAAYIPLSGATGRRWPGLSGLAVASCVGSLGLAPFAVASGGRTILDPTVLVVGMVVAVLSSVIPYSCELVALRTMSPRVFGVLMSLDPAAAALAGVVVLAELLGPLQWVAVGCVVLASVGVTRSAPPVLPPPVRSARTGSPGRGGT